MESCNHHCKKNYHKLVFWVFAEQLLSHISFERLYRYEVALGKKNKGKDTLGNFSFRAFREIQFQGRFMKYEILS